MTAIASTSLGRGGRLLYALKHFSFFSCTKKQKGSDDTIVRASTSPLRNDLTSSASTEVTTNITQASATKTNSGLYSSPPRPSYKASIAQQLGSTYQLISQLESDAEMNYAASKDTSKSDLVRINLFNLARTTAESAVSKGSNKCLQMLYEMSKSGLPKNVDDSSTLLVDKSDHDNVDRLASLYSNLIFDSNPSTQAKKWADGYYSAAKDTGNTDADRASYFFAARDIGEVAVSLGSREAVTMLHDMSRTGLPKTPDDNSVLIVGQNDDKRNSLWQEVEAQLDMHDTEFRENRRSFSDISYKAQAYCKFSETAAKMTTYAETARLEHSTLKPEHTTEAHMSKWIAAFDVAIHDKTDMPQVVWDAVRASPIKTPLWI